MSALWITRRNRCAFRLYGIYGRGQFHMGVKLGIGRRGKPLDVIEREAAVYAVFFQHIHSFVVSYGGFGFCFIGANDIIAADMDTYFIAETFFSAFRFSFAVGKRYAGYAMETVEDFYVFITEIRCVTVDETVIFA